MKAKLGEKIKKFRTELKVSTHKMRQKGIHTNAFKNIEESRTNYTIDNLITYIETINMCANEIDPKSKKITLDMLFK